MNTFRLQNGTAPPKYYDRAVTYSKGRYGGFGKNLIKGWGLQIGITAAVLGVGYFLDYVTGDINKQPEQAPMNCNIVYQATNFNANATKSCSFATVVSMAQAQCNTYAKSSTGNTGAICLGFPSSPNVPLPSPGNNANHGQMVQIVIPGTGYVQNTPFNVAIENYAQPQSLPATPAHDPMTDEEIGDTFVNAPNPSTRVAPLVNPNTGDALRTQEVANAEKALYNEVAPDLGKEQSTATPVTPNADPNAQPDVGYDELPKKFEMSVEFPDFCGWATAICDAIDWFKESDEKPVDADWKLQDNITTLNPEAVNYSSGFGTGSCPAPRSFSVLSTSLTYSYQPICDLAEVARIFVLLFAYLSSVYIVMGVRK
jgi:hypothetical protein